jgi:hypothetical protein
MDNQVNKELLSKQQIKAELWRRGNLSYKLYPHQKDLYDLYYKTDEKLMVWLLGRRSGKSTTLCIIAIETCIKTPNTIVKFVAPTKTQLHGYVRSLMRPLLEDCPEELKPEFRSKDYSYIFPNGSEIHLAGSDNKHAEKLRGSAAHLCVVDEAGSCDDLENTVKSILLPTTLTTNGKIILASTPPMHEDHDFLKFIEAAEANKTLIKKTIFDNTILTQKQIENEIKIAGGVHTEYFRREYLCEIIRDSSSTVIPEFTDELQKQIIKEWPRPPYFDWYASMDLGGSADLTVVLFAYYDFRADKLIIEDELVIQAQEQEYVPKLINGIKDKENQLFKNAITNEVKAPYMRVSDINFIATSEIARQSAAMGYPVVFSQAKKDDRDTAINNLRLLLGNGKIIINPRCTTLIRHLKNGRWKPSKKEFARSQDNGHYDAIAAAYYLCRAVVFGRNPYPAGYDLNMKDLYVVNPGAFTNQQSKDMSSVLHKLFTRKR